MMPPIVCRYPALLGPVENNRLYDYAVAHRASYAGTAATTNTPFYPDWRRSQVLNGGAHAGFYQRLQEEVRRRFPEVAAALGLAVPPNPQNPVNPVQIELQLTSHNDGEHYKIHSDNGNAATASRIGTFVYYFHREPKAFTGGELLVYGSRDHRNPGPPREVIEPENDLLIFFDPHLLHEVTNVRCPSKEFADGRFTLNGWIRAQ